MSEHPSYLDLDLLAVGAGSEEVRAHVATCDRCRAHLTEVSAPEPVPDWVRPQRRSRAWIVGLAALALAAGALVAPMVFPQADDAPYVGVKGGDPVVSVYRRRGQDVTQLETGGSVRAGDSIRLAVVSSQHETVRVLSGETVLFDGPIPDADDGLLPTSWRIDDQGLQETLTIELSGGATPWTTELTFPKDR